MGQTAETNEEKSRLLHATFFSDLVREDLGHPGFNYPAPKFKVSPITNEKIHRVISKLGTFTAPLNPLDPMVSPTFFSLAAWTWLSLTCACCTAQPSSWGSIPPARETP